MSHIEEGRTKIKLTALAEALKQPDARALEAHPCLALLRQAVALVAQARGGWVGTTYDDYSYEAQPTNLNLSLILPRALPRGVGLTLDQQTGELVFLGDPWNHRVTFREVQQAIVQNYVVLAHAAALSRMNAQVTTQMVGQQVVITGVFHG